MIAPVLFFVSTGLSGAKGFSFTVLRILLITLYSELRFRWPCTLWKACEILYKILLKIISFDQSLSTSVIGDHRLNRCFQKLAFTVLRILVITLYSELRFWWSCTLWKACKMLYKIRLMIISFDQSSSTGVTGATQKTVFPCFGHNFLLQTSILMILNSMESLWKSLKGYPEVHVIRSIF